MMDQRNAQACWIVAKEQAELRSERLPACAADEVLIETRFSGVSRGTESLWFRHEVPESERLRMRAPHQAGDLPGPVKYGYSNVGRVLEGPAELRGASVFCLYPHQTAYVVEASWVLKLPDDVPEARAVLAANMETALNVLWDAEPRGGERVIVIGAGVVGSLAGYLAARLYDCEVTLVDVHEDRAQLAAALGLDFARSDQMSGDAPLVIHASGNPSGLRRALDLAADGGTIIEASWFGDKDVCLPLGGAFHARRLTLRSSQVGQVAPAMRARYTPRARLELALRLLGDEALDALISAESAFSALPDTLRRLAAPDTRALCERIVYGSQP